MATYEVKLIFKNISYINIKYLFKQDYNSYDGKLLRDSGVVGDLWFDIIDGKKVYKKWAGVN